MQERRAIINTVNAGKTPAIDYTYKKLLEYDLDVYASDKIIKDNELEIVLSEMERTYHFTYVRNYLDIGFCTGRYPFTMRQFLQNGNYIAGIDAEYNCYEYALIQNTKRQAGINFFCSDFISDDASAAYHRNYELITCMLGTISHFCKEKNQLSNSLRKMVNLLSANGVLIISNWSQKGISSGMLSIYSTADRNLLQCNTPATTSIVNGLAAMQLNCNIVTTNDGMLDVIFCRKE